MRVRIIKSEDELDWYSNHIGEEYEVIVVPNGEGVAYEVVEPGSKYESFWIDSDDARITYKSIDDAWESPAKAPNIQVKISGDPSTQWSKSHYDYDYKLTAEDIECGSIRIDPYFVSNIWKLGSKDESGALFHTLKTIARFNVKNEVEREVKALHAQVLALARVKGVKLS